MPPNSDSSYTPKIRYKNNKSVSENEQDYEILIESERTSEPVCSEVQNPFIILLAVLFTIILVMVAGLLCSAYLSNTLSNPSHNSPVVTKQSKINQTHEPGLMNNTRPSCSPLNVVDKVVITSSTLVNHSCSDNATCQSMLYEIKRDGEEFESKYNFVVYSFIELNTGLGYECQVNSSESALYIHILRGDLSKNTSQSEYLIFSEIINRGISHGKIMPNYTVTAVCSTEDNCPEARWTTQVMNTSVEFLPEEICLPFIPMRKISIDFVETASFSSSKKYSGDEMTRKMEEEHDGPNYNFIIGTNAELYVGLGFRCGSNNSRDTLKVKMLMEVTEYSRELMQFIRLAQIIKQGVLCGDILSGYSISMNCLHCPIGRERYFSIFPKELLEYIDGFDYLVRYVARYQYISNHEKGDGKVLIGAGVRWKACHLKNHITEPTSMSKQEKTSDRRMPEEDYEY